MEGWVIRSPPFTPALIVHLFVKGGNGYFCIYFFLFKQELVDKCFYFRVLICRQLTMPMPPTIEKPILSAIPKVSHTLRAARQET